LGGAVGWTFALLQSDVPPTIRSRALILFLVAALAVLAYAPLFTQPFVQDDYPDIEMARVFGAPAGLGAMLSHPIFRYRATWWVMAYWTDRIFGFSPAAAYSVAIALHIVCAWLVYALGAWKAIGWRVSAAAAAFFAVYEGHQEAVMWYNSAHEELLFLFGVAGFLAWVRFLDGGSWRWYAVSLAAFPLALLSKETAVVFALLLLVPMALQGRRRFGLWLPFALMAAAEVWLLLGVRSYSFRFHDGSFSLHAPFWITWPESYLRLLWVWGLLALGALLALRAVQYRRAAILAAVWTGLALVPYSFITYMHRLPSRHTYLASAGLALLVGAGFVALRDRVGLRWALAAASLAIAVNVGILWTKKRQQFLERAAPTERLIVLARQVNGPIYMRCFPDPGMIADSAVRMRAPASTLIWDPAHAAEAKAEFCYVRK
jgi:hypothetical protein